MAFSGITKTITQIIDGISPDLPTNYNYYIGIPFWLDTSKDTNDINFFPNIIFLNNRYQNNNNLGVYTGIITTTMIITEHSEEENLFEYIEEVILSKILQNLSITFDEVKVNFVVLDNEINSYYSVSVDLEIVFEYKTI